MSYVIVTEPGPRAETAPAYNPGNITMNTIRVLAALLDAPHQAHYQREVCRLTGVDRTLVRDTLNSLRRREWIVDVEWLGAKHPVTRGRARRYFVLTPLGRDAATAVLRDLADILRVR
jgi:DNA-binding MarR family transcriptional regulator